jgi:hypothetical protein
MLWDETKIGCSLQKSTSCVGSRKKWSQNEGNAFLEMISIKNQLKI